MLIKAHLRAIHQILHFYLVKFKNKQGVFYSSLIFIRTTYPTFQNLFGDKLIRISLIQLTSQISHVKRILYECFNIQIY